MHSDVTCFPLPLPASIAFKEITRILLSARILLSETARPVSRIHKQTNDRHHERCAGMQQGNPDQAGNGSETSVSLMDLLTFGCVLLGNATFGSI